MSLKVNVIYDGIIYRVKGMKILCSVVLAVILLLVAIVGMGVWMIVTVYDDDRSLNVAVNSSAPTINNKKLAPSIDFKNPQQSILKTTTQKIQITETSPKDIIESSSMESYHIAPEPNLAVFGAGLYDLTENKEFPEETKDHPYAKDTFESFLPSRKVISSEDVKDFEKLPPSLIPKNLYGTFEDENRRSDDLGAAENDYPEYSSYEYSEDAIDPSSAFAHRSGTTDEQLTYVGPPVVGYGSNPYERLSKDKLEDFDNFWKHYGDPNSLSTINQQGKLPVDPPHTKGPAMRPHLRGLRPSMEEDYKIPIRPDAQVPSQDPDRNRRIDLRDQPPYRRQVTPDIRPNLNRHPPPRRPVSLRQPGPSRQPVPSRLNPNRILNVGTRPPMTERTKPPPRTSVPLMGSLQELYDYSKGLAASILNFNMKSDDQFISSLYKMSTHGIKLLEDYNKVFKPQNNGGPLSALSAIIPTTERLRSLDPFELTLVTWTFLDFWEFLIEKVGTLSDEDLEMLQERLDKLRKRKDKLMTKALVNDTLLQMSDSNGRSQSQEIVKKSILENHKSAEENQDPDDDKSPTILGRSISSDNRTLNITAMEQLLLTENDKESNNEKKQWMEVLSNSSAVNHGNILGELFPRLSIEHKNYLTNLSSNSEETETSENQFNFSNFTESDNLTAIVLSDPDLKSSSRSGRMWDPLGLFSSEGRMQFMQFAVKVVFNFGKVYMKKPYALDCLMLLFCKDLNSNTNKGGVDGMAAKLKSVGLKVLTESDQQLREADTFNEIWRSVTAWTPLQCDVMFPRCDGSKALEIVNEVALGSD